MNKLQSRSSLAMNIHTVNPQDAEEETIVQHKILD